MQQWIYSSELKQSNGESSSDEQNKMTSMLESGKVIYLPQLDFSLETDEQICLSPNFLASATKNISFNPVTKKLGGVTAELSQQQLLMKMMQRFSLYAKNLVINLCPIYQSSLQVGRTSFRPAEILGRKTSFRKDDTRLHVDAFPSSPNQGRRILRVFSNINPADKTRVWRLGEPFTQMLDTFLPRVKKALPGSSALLRALRLTKSLRTPYDHFMLQLHDQMKSDLAYQQQVEQLTFEFPSQTTWMVFTDVASHAAMSGQYLLEQTFYLPVAAMQDEKRAPLRILESRLGKVLS